jgi:hypothetical protein
MSEVPLFMGYPKGHAPSLGGSFDPTGVPRS